MTTELRRAGKLARHIIPLTVVLCFLWPGELRADNYREVPAAGLVIDVELLPSELPTSIRIELSGQRRKDTFAPNHVVRALFINCFGAQIDEQLYVDFPQEVTGDGGGNHFFIPFSVVSVTHEVICGNFPRKVIIESKNGLSTAGFTQIGELDIPAPEFSCSASPEELECFVTCGKKARIESAELKLYKSSPTIYSLPQTDRSGASLGETVNGLFVAPGEGILFVSVDGANGMVDVWGSSSANGDGWMTSNGRKGTLINGELCLEVEEDQFFKFNVQAGRGDKIANLSINFKWAAWISDECCVQYAEEQVDLRVEPLPCGRDGVVPTTPQRQVHYKCLPGEQAPACSVDYEIRIPCCGCSTSPPCASGACPLNRGCVSGNLYDWFIAWPTQLDQMIRQGPAKGWTITANGMIEPGPGGKVTVFE